MAPKELKISKQAADVKRRDITLTIPETFEIITETISAIGQSCHYDSIQDWSVDHLWYKETQGKNYV
jgi:hypothetical protein